MHVTELGRDLRRIAEAVFAMVLSLEVGPAPRDPGEERGADERTVDASIAIRGSWHGSVHLRCAERLAVRAAAIVFGVAGEPTREQVHDAMGELANMIGGNVKALLPPPARLALPRVVEATGWSSGGARESAIVARVALECGDDSAVVTVLSSEGTS